MKVVRLGWSWFVFFRKSVWRIGWWKEETVEEKDTINPKFTYGPQKVDSLLGDTLRAIREKHKD